MVELGTKFRGQQQLKDRAERLQALRSRGLRVEPTDDKWRILKHPRGGKFRATGSAEWPDDDFTRRRIRAGSLRIVEQKEAPKREAKSAPRASET